MRFSVISLLILPVILFSISCVQQGKKSELGTELSQHQRNEALIGECMVCHSNQEAQRGPVLHGMENWYLLDQLEKFRSGVRGQNPKNKSEYLMGIGARKIKNDYEIEGLIKDASINFLNKANFKNINFNFNFQKDNYHFDEINFKAEEVNFISKKLNVKKKNNSFLIDAVVENDQSSLNSNLLRLLNLSFENIIVDDAIFKTNNEFSLEIDEKFKVKNIILNSDINITKLKYKNLKIINKYFPEVDDLILLDNHKLNLNYKDKNLLINGEGQIQLNPGEVDEIKYFINKKDNDLSIDSELFLQNIVLEQQDFLKIFFPQTNENINFNNQKLKINFKNNNLTFSGSIVFILS